VSDKIRTIRLAATVSLAHALDLVQELHPGGRLQKTEYITCNALRGDAKPSLHINLVNGKANDVASPDYHYGDLVAVAADVWGVNQYEAAQMILSRYGYEQGDPSAKPNPDQAKRLATLQARIQKRLEDDQNEREKREETVRRLIVPKIWQRATPASRPGRPGRLPHPYARKKRVAQYNARLEKCLDSKKLEMVIPVCDLGQLVNLQFIAENGNKRFIKGGRVTGCYAPIGRMEEGKTLYICEGWATGATLMQKHGGAVACALFAANLEPVARKLRKHYGPGQHIVIAGDDDRANKVNAGRKAAESAAQAIGADLMFPEFPADAPKTLSDFNDLHVYQVENWKPSAERGAYRAQ
jgi:putative DNA primase/helicase